MTECALCPKDENTTWLGGYEVGEYVICEGCYQRYIAAGETPGTHR